MGLFQLHLARASAVCDRLRHCDGAVQKADGLVSLGEVSAVKERPILFSAPMVKALLAGAKTQTRRIVKWPEWVTDTDAAVYELRFRPEVALFKDGNPVKRFGCPYGQPGDRLYVRETWQDWCPTWGGGWCGCGSKEMVAATHKPAYRATPDERGQPLKWRPAIHMPRWASRITLEITEIRVQRLQEINRESHDDILQEGWPFGLEPKERNPIHDFRELWESINGTGSWDANPWVWAVSFKVVKP